MNRQNKWRTAGKGMCWESSTILFRRGFRLQETVMYSYRCSISSICVSLKNKRKFYETIGVAKKDYNVKVPYYVH